MKLYLKLIAGIVGLTSISRALLAADSTTTYTTYPATTRAPLNYAASSSIATSSSNAVMVALNAQALLLKEMMQEHQKRAADLTQNSQSEKAKWETDLVNELQEKNARVQKSLDQATQPRPGTNNPKAAAGDVDDQLVFVSTVEARLEQLRQELSAALDDTRALSVQIGTNKVPEDIAGMSLVLGENQRLVKELQREQLDLELRKLEFNAIRKVMQK
jgi:small-conductance mechanosensitive channel